MEEEIKSVLKHIQDKRNEAKEAKAKEDHERRLTQLAHARDRKRSSIVSFTSLKQGRSQKGSIFSNKSDAQSMSTAAQVELQFDGFGDYHQLKYLKDYFNKAAER